MHQATQMKSENELRSDHANALARLRNASDNIADAKENLRLAVLNHGFGSKAWHFWNSEIKRHETEWLATREELREIEHELRG